MHKRSAFTLVELLVVVAIIGILATLITQAAVAARQYVKVARIKIEMHQVEMALEMYKTKYGEYPPDFNDQEAVVRHIKKRWPRYTPVQTVAPYAAATTSTQAYTYFIEAIRKKAGWDFAPGPGSNYQKVSYGASFGAIPFWLGGLPNNTDGTRGTSVNTGGNWDNNGDNNNPNWTITLNSGTTTEYHPLTHLIGFSANPADPFDVGSPSKHANAKYPRTQTESPIMEFRLGKNLAIFNYNTAADGSGHACTAVVMNDSPLVYFQSNKSRQERAYAMPDGGYANLTNYSGQSGNPRVLTCFNSIYAGTPAFNFRMVADGTRMSFQPGVAVPYADSGSMNPPWNIVRAAWRNPETYQLIHPGLDECFGRRNVNGNPNCNDNGKALYLSDGTGLDQFDLDNIVNFGEGTIKATLP